MNGVQVLNSFHSVERSTADALLVAVNSFETRCLGFARFLSKCARSYRAANVLLISYSDRGDRAIRARSRANAPLLRELLARTAESNRIEECQLEPYEVIEAFAAFTQLFQSLAPESSVVVDISTMPKLHVLYLIEAAARSRRIGTLRLVYTRARYGRYDTLSWGAEEPIILPCFGTPRIDRHHPERLILFCGLEPDRCYGVWRRFGQSACVKIFVDAGEADHDRCADRARRLNSYDPEALSFTVDAFRPDRAKALLRRLYDEAVAAGEYMYVAPFATKWETIAAWELVSELGQHAPVGILYAAPGRINAAGHTRDDLGECLMGVLWQDRPPGTRDNLL